MKSDLNEVNCIHRKKLKENTIKSEHWIFPKGAMDNLLFPCCKICRLHLYPRKKRVTFKNISTMSDLHTFAGKYKSRSFRSLPNYDFLNFFPLIESLFRFLFGNLIAKF